MIKIFVNVRLEKYSVATSEFTKEYIAKLLQLTQVETTFSFDENDVVSLMLLDQADRLHEFMCDHDLHGRVGLAYNLSHNYPFWTLIVDTACVKGSINPLVSKFFRWERIESQSILTFDELLEM